MDFETYQKQYVNFMKALAKTRIIGKLVQEIFASYPENLPRKYQNQMSQEFKSIFSLQLPDYNDVSEYTKQMMLLYFLNKYTLNYLHLRGKKARDEFISTNPPLKEIYNMDIFGEELIDPDMPINQFEKLLESDPTLKERIDSRTTKIERFQQAWLFDNWLYYQEFIMVMSLLESFFRDSYEMLRATFTKVQQIEKIPKNLEDCCFLKLFDELMNENYKLVQRIGPKNTNYINDCWKIRNAIVHNGGIVNEKIINQKKDFPYKVGEIVKIDSMELEKLYKLIGNLQNIIYKRIRLAQKT